MTDEFAESLGTDSAAVEDLAAVASEAVQAGGEYLRARFQSGEADAEYTDTDVKMAADREAEARVLSAVRDSHPEHAISAEESGDHPGEGLRWVVDALDGTNNFAVGVPTFGVAATACEPGPDPEPLATAVAVPMLKDLYVAPRGGGVRYNGRTVEIADGDAVPLSSGTVGLIIGPEVISGGRAGREWDAITESVRDTCKRAIQTWAPVVYWGLLARGRLDGFVCYYPAEREQVAGSLLAREAGAHERADGPLTVFGATPEIRDQLWDAAQRGLAQAEREG